MSKWALHSFDADVQADAVLQQQGSTQNGPSQGSSR